MIVYTARVDYWKTIVVGGAPFGVALYDITVKNANTWFTRNFAPTWPMVRKYKAGWSEAEYESKYIELLNERFVNNETYRQMLIHTLIGLENSHISPIFACYCKPGEFCHRVLAVKWLLSFIKEFAPNITLNYGGEL